MRGAAVSTSLAAAPIALLVAHALVGPGELSVSDAFQALAGSGDSIAREIVWTIRIPRALTALLVGAALGLSGAALQDSCAILSPMRACWAFRDLRRSAP
jgi:iron complex transport system permease protein